MFRLRDDAVLGRLRERLGALQYTEKGVSLRLRIWHISAITLQHYPVYHERLRQRFDALSVVISLFLLQGEVTREAAGGALGPDLTNDLLKLGLLARTRRGVVAAPVSIYPCSGLYFVTDHHFRPASHDRHAAPEQPVMHLGQDSYALAYLAAELPKRGRVLDLCTGSGVHAIMAARRAEYVIGVDVNPRAVEFARLNAALNGVASKCDFRRGSLYDAVSREGADDERFDLILANPPFVPSSRAGGGRLLFQDGGPSGEEVLRPVLAGLVRHLKPGGKAAVFSMFADQKGSHHRAKIKRWVGKQAPVELLLLKVYSVEPEELASVITLRLFEDDFATYSRRYTAWLDALKSNEIVRLTYGVLVVRTSRESDFQTINVPIPQALSKRRAGEISRLISRLA